MSSPSYADVPSTAWNVSVASGVAVVVYLGVQMGTVLPAIAAGTILFVGGWMTGYAINQDPPISLPRMLVGGGICGFVVWTLLISPGKYVLGGVVIALVSFAAWFTSGMGPIKGETRSTAPIDEPRPPEGSPPGTPVDLGGETESSASSDGSRGSSVLGGLRDMLSPSEADAPEPPESSSPGPAGPSTEELRDQPPADEAEDGPTYSTRRTEPDEQPGGEKESIVGLGIFYEGDPDPAPAGAGTEPTGVEDANAAKGREQDAKQETESASAGSKAETGVEEENPASEELPEEHRVEIEDDGGFQFG